MGNETQYPTDRSQRAKQLVKEGKIGGPRAGSGRPRKKRAAEVVAEEARKHAQLIIDAYVDSLQDNQPAAIRLQAAKEWLQIEHDETKLQMREEEFDQLTQDQLIAMIAQTMAKVEGHIEIPEAEIVEEEVEELPERTRGTYGGSPFSR